MRQLQEKAGAGKRILFYRISWWRHEFHYDICSSTTYSIYWMKIIFIRLWLIYILSRDASVFPQCTAVIAISTCGQGSGHFIGDQVLVRAFWSDRQPAVFDQFDEEVFGSGWADGDAAVVCHCPKLAVSSWNYSGFSRYVAWRPPTSSGLSVQS